jgi:hypothetical protein
MKQVRVKVKNQNGFQETAILPITAAKLSVRFSGSMAHYANMSTGKLLLSVDIMDSAVNFADPSVLVEHKFDGHVQLFVGNFISLKPIKG